MNVNLERRLKRVSIGEEQMVSIISGRARLYLPSGSRIVAIYQSMGFYPLHYWLVIDNPSFDVVPVDQEVPVSHEALYEFVEDGALLRKHGPSDEDLDEIIAAWREHSRGHEEITRGVIFVRDLRAYAAVSDRLLAAGMGRRQRPVPRLEIILVQSIDDCYKVAGMEYTFMAFHKTDTWPLKEFVYLRSRLRALLPVGCKLFPQWAAGI